MIKTLYIFGASGFSREVADIALNLNYKEIKFIDLVPGQDEITGFEIIAEDYLGKLDLEQCEFIIGVGEGSIRERIFNKFSDLKYINLIHPSVTFGNKQYEQIKLQKGNILCAGARLTSNIKMGNFGVYNLNITVGHDCVIDDFVTISPGANVSGNVHLKNCTYIGTGATILQGHSLEKKLTINEGATVGAGAVVVKEVSSNTIVKGIPAK